MAALRLPERALALAGSFAQRLDARGPVVLHLVDEGRDRVDDEGSLWSREARQATSDWAFGKDVRLVVTGSDRYGRTVGRVLVSGKDLSVELVRAGYAWHFTQYSQDPELAAAEREARASRRGLWQDRAPVPPWEWRERHRDR